MWEVDDVPMISPAWTVLNIQVLWTGPTVVFSNRQQAGTRGRKPYPGLEDEARFSVRFHLLGQYDINGDPYDDPQEGLELNYFYLRENVWDPVDPVRTSTVTTPSGLELTTAIQFEPFPMDELIGLSDYTGNLGIVLPEGAHYPGGS
jgi:hypothetical protein